MIIMYIIAGIIGLLAALGLVELVARIADRFDARIYRKRQHRRVMAQIKDQPVSMFHKRQAE